MKQLRPELKDDWRYRSVYRKEYEVGHGIDSKYIVKYEAIGENAEGTYILMEHVNGLTIDEKLASEPEYFAKEKAGIIKENIPVVIGEWDDRYANVFIEKAKEN